MNKFNRMIIGAGTSFILFLIAVNLLLPHYFQNSTGKYYMIEINRVYDQIQKDNLVLQPDLSDCKYLIQVDYLKEGADKQELNVFFEPGSHQYRIKIVKIGDIDYFIKFTYKAAIEETYHKVLLWVNIGIAILGLAIIILLIYIKRNILAPFQKISELPFQLSKGHLEHGLKEQKSRYFGRFLWGLDMLRETLKEHRNKELALTKEKKTMVLMISHDIKTPLSAIRLYTKALSDDLYEDPEKRQEIIGNIGKKADEIECFVQDIIKTSKEDFLNIEVVNSDFYVTELIDKLLDYYQDKLALIKCEFTIDSYENSLIYGDLEKSLEAFGNIIENALKYGDGKAIGISFEIEEDCQLITVKNTGNTLDSSEIVHIWDSFWQGSNAKGKQGSGLGLYICKQIMMKMKGDIYAFAEGDEISFTLVFKRP